MLREAADRDAIVHQVYVELIGDKGLRASYAGGDLGAWIGAIARHRALDFARREQRLVDLSEAPPATTEVAGPLEELRRALEHCARQMPPERRRLIELRFVLGMTQVEAAAELAMPRSTLEDWEKQVKRELRRQLLGSDRGDDDEASKRETKR